MDACVQTQYKVMIWEHSCFEFIMQQGLFLQWPLKQLFTKV